MDFLLAVYTSPASKVRRCQEKENLVESIPDLASRVGEPLRWKLEEEEEEDEDQSTIRIAR